MKLPLRRSRGEVVLSFLHRESNTIEQGIVRHSDFGISRAKILTVYSNLVTGGCATVVGGVYSITDDARRHLDAAGAKGLASDAVSEPEVARAVVGPRFTREFSAMKSNRPRLQEMREGSFGYRDVPSRIGSTSVPFASSLVLKEDGDGHA